MIYGLGDTSKAGMESFEKPNRGLSSNVLARRKQSGYLGKWGGNDTGAYKGSNAFMTDAEWATYQQGQKVAAQDSGSWLTGQATQPSTSSRAWWMGTTTPAVDYTQQMQANPYLNMFMGSSNSTIGKAMRPNNPVTPTTSTDPNSWSSGNWELDPTYTSGFGSLEKRYKNKLTGETRMVH